MVFWKVKVLVDLSTTKHKFQSNIKRLQAYQLRQLWPPRLVTCKNDVFLDFSSHAGLNLLNKMFDN